MTAFWLYLWVKLDDIIYVLSSDYALSIILAILFIVYLAGVSAVTPDKDGDNFPFSGFFGSDDNVKESLRKIRNKLVKIVTIVFALQLIFNVIAALLPTTKQLAVIYTISTGVESETFNALKSLDKDFANYLQTEAKSWLKEQASNINKSTNTIDKEVTK